MVNKFIFFQEVTYRLFASPDFTEGMWEALHYIQQYMPVDDIRVFNNLLDKDYLDHLATIDPGESHFYQPSKIIDLENFKIIQSDIDNYRILLINNPSKNELTKKIVAEKEVPESSFIILGVVGDQNNEIIISFRTAQRNRYVKQNLDLLKRLHRSFKIAIQKGLDYLNKLETIKSLKDDKKYLLEQSFEEIRLIGKETGLKGVYQQLRRVAKRETPVCLTGEFGVEKDAAALTIHRNSARRNRNFIIFNCADYIDGENLFPDIEKEPTGNNQRSLLERAHKGTIYLKGIENFKPDLQESLLTALKSKELKINTSRKNIALDIRLICSSGRDLAESMKEDYFTRQFYAYITQTNIGIPPLRNRIGDLPSLLKHYTKVYASEFGMREVPSISSGGMEILLNYDWPGNTQELCNVLKREILANPHGPLNFLQLKTKGVKATASSDKVKETLPTLEEHTSSYLKRVIDYTKGQIEGEEGAAQILNIHPSTLRHRLRKLNISYGRKWKKS